MSSALGGESGRRGFLVPAGAWQEISLFGLTEGRKQMTLECINPPDLPTPKTYTQVVVASGTRLIFVSGQEPEDLDGKLVGRGDFAVQARQVFTNLGRALAGAGALPRDVARITVYVVNYQRDYHLPIIEGARLTLVGDHKAADVVVGVAALSPDYLIEVDAIAVVDG
jgi:enamine deaminase RidA (YjgF/YER057c/UK114 family)